MRKLFLLLICVALFSCKGENSSRKVAVFEEMVDSSDEDFLDDEACCDSSVASTGYRDIISVPFKEKTGVKTVEVKINDVIGVDMIIDTGCSGMLISLSEAKYLIDKGTLTRDDIIGTGKSQIADGSIVENDIVRLHKVTIGDKLTLENVIATVSNKLDAPLLLGNEVFNRVQSISIDNKNKQILFYVN